MSRLLKESFQIEGFSILILILGKSGLSIVMGSIDFFIIFNNI